MNKCDVGDKGSPRKGEDKMLSKSYCCNSVIGYLQKVGVMRIVHL